MSFLPYGHASTSGWFGAFGASVVFHGLAIVGIIGLSASTLTIKVVPATASFTVTLDQLDADTLAGLIQQDGAVGSEGQTPDDTPDPARAPDGDDQSGAQPAQTDGTIALPLETPSAIIPDTLTGQPPQTDTIMASPIIAETLSPVGNGAPLAVVAPAPVETVTGNLDGSGVAAKPQPPAPPTDQDLAVADLIAQIRAAPPQPCLIALPRRDGADGVGLALIAAQDSAMEAGAASILTPDDTDVRQTRTLIDTRQCAALEVVADNDIYPAMRLGIQIDSRNIMSGDTISGVLRGVAGRFLTVVLVDDNGVVTDIGRFVSTSGNLARFDVPVTRVGLARDTSPIILAIATDRPAPLLKAQLGQLARDVFTPATTARLNGALLGLVTVDIR